MTDNHACYMCGRPVTPCANCGGVEGHMVETHGIWIHERQVDCIIHLNSELKKARARMTELELRVAALGAATPAPQEEPTT